jgi:hypothetical protein
LHLLMADHHKEAASCRALNGSILTSPIQSERKGSTAELLSLRELDPAFLRLPPLRMLDNEMVSSRRTSTVRCIGKLSYTPEKSGKRKFATCKDLLAL